MSERKKQIFLEALKKAKKESVMGKLANGDTDPMEPWSKKHAPLDEVNAQVLWRYIKAMGRDPRTISLNDRLNLARTDRFKKFARDHVKLIQQQKEEVEQIDEMDKSAPQPGRDGKVSHSTYGSRDKEGDDYFKGKEVPVKPITVKKMEKDALDILKKQRVAEVWKGHSSTVKNPNFNDELSYRRVNPMGKRLKSGKLSADERGSQERTKALIKYTQKRGGLAGPKGPLPEDQCVAEKIVNEAGTGLLMSYIKSKGLDPRAMDGNQRHKYSQSSEFKLFKHRRMKAETSGMGERGEDWNEEKKPVKEAVDQKDTVTMDIPLLIRVLEFIREDVKTDMDLHRVVENLIQVRNDGVLTMNHYDQIVHIKKMKEEVEQVDEVSTSWIKKKAPDYPSRAHAQSVGLRKKVYSIFKDTQATSDEKRKFKSRLKGLNSYRKKTDAEYSAKRGGYPSYHEPEKRLGGYDPRSGKSYSEQVEQIDELKKQSDTQDMDSHITREDLRKWFSKTDPEGGWKRINSKGEAIGPCAREPGEPKPKCMSNEKRAKLTKKERAAAVAAKRKHDPVADRPGKGGKPVNVSNFGKGKISEEGVDEACWSTHKQVGMKKKGNKMVPDCVPKNEEVELLDEKNKPTNPKLWARAKSLARSKFDVYPSAYANGWASKWYKSKGGGWRATSEEVEVNEGIYGIEDSPLSATNSVKAMESRMAKEKSKSARMIKAIYKKKGLKKETIYDWEKTEKGGEKEPNAKIILKGGYRDWETDRKSTRLNSSH